MAKSKLVSARQKLEELGYDPITALVEIAQNRNQMGDLRVRAAMALLPYVYTQMATKVDMSVTANTGVLAVPKTADEATWAATVDEMKRQATERRAAEDAEIAANRAENTQTTKPTVVH